MKFVENIQETLYTQNLAILRHSFRYFIAVTKSKLLDLSFQFATTMYHYLRHKHKTVSISQSIVFVHMKRLKPFYLATAQKHHSSVITVALAVLNGGFRDSPNDVAFGNTTSLVD